MRKQLLCLTAALAIAGCAADRQDASAPSSKATASVDGIVRDGLASTPRTVYAAMPDRGAILAYQRGQQPVRRAAHTYHAIELSESHALNAAAPGKSISLPLPSGETMQIAYQRHEEGLDGNWSWVGKTDDGLDAVITFGEKAVFGRIAQRDTEALRLTMAGGRSWLIETDPSKLLDGNLGRDADASDVLIPPSVATAISAKKRSSAAAKITASDEAAGPADTVDVVLGFTNGLVTKYGGVSQATTRLANLIAITNQGYTNSLVTPRIRLVRTVQVNYTDTNSNEVALEAVTGQVCTTTGCTPQAVPAELVPLRTARDQYGGDLVSIVRPFQAPQHQGCGIAWLLGGGGFTIDNTDEPFGYSVISDGSDVDETDGRSYFCREETLAHELGHNMGQQHNVEDSGGDLGTHTYSYGYRETTTTGFYTVMAYRLANSSQFSINHFGNPSVTYASTGRPTGSATADNARSLNISMPLVAQFRATVVPFAVRARNDINGNGTSDLLWHNGANLSWWETNSTGAVIATGGQATPANYIAVATGDFDGNGASDVLWRSGTNLRMWLKSPTGGYTESQVNTYPLGWRLVGAGDVNNDGRSDLFWQLGTTVSVWLMNGSSITNYTNASIPLGNSGNMPLAVADFSCDGRADVLWRNTSNELVTWVAQSSGSTATSTAFAQQTIATYPNGWITRGAGDFNGDGCQDITWFNSSALSYWLLTANGSGVISITGTGGRALPAAANLVAIVDINGNGLADAAIREPNGVMSALMDFGTGTTQQSLFTYPAGWLAVDGQSPYIWRRSVTGDLNADQRSDLGWTNGSAFSFWTMYGSVVQSVSGQNFATARTVVGSGDFNGDLLQDVLFRTNAGELLIWRRTQTQFVEEAISAYPAGWTVAGIGDIDGDGRDDIIWQNGSTFSYWVMEGNTVRLVGGQVLPSAYTPLATSDFDGDGRADILWRAAGDQLHVSKSIGLAFNNALIGSYPTGWTFLGAGDVDGDLAYDLMWHNGSGVFSHWKMLGFSPSAQAGQAMAITGTVVATGDYDGNGRTDMVWRTASNELILAIPNGTPTQAASTYLITSYPTGWTAVR